MHIVKISPEIDNFTGKCLGKANLQVRVSKNSSKIERFKSKLIENGYKINSIFSSKGKKKQNFGFSENIKSSVSLCNDRKQTVSTCDSFYKNDSGIGKTNVLQDKISLKEIRENRENLRMWNITKNVSTIRSKAPQNNYFKPTLSSSNKRKPS